MDKPKASRLDKSRPLFLQRIHERHEQEVAKKRKDEERKRLMLLTLDLASVVLKANQHRPVCRYRRKPNPKKDIWSHIGDFVFGD